MIDLNDVLRVVAEWDGPAGSLAQLVYHFRVAAGNDEAPADVLGDIKTALETAWANIEDIVDDNWTFATLELYLRDVGAHQWDGVATTVSANLDGITAGDSVPQGAAALVKFFTELGRRQGRKYIMGLVETVQADGTITAPNVTKLALFGADLDDSVTSGSETLVFGTYNVDPLSALYESFSDNIQTAQAEAVFAYQRRRRPGTGV